LEHRSLPAVVARHGDTAVANQKTRLRRLPLDSESASALRDAPVCIALDAHLLSRDTNLLRELTPGRESVDLADQCRLPYHRVVLRRQELVVGAVLALGILGA
jgi:hypothetical protein